MLYHWHEFAYELSVMVMKKKEVSMRKTCDKVVGMNSIDVLEICDRFSCFWREESRTGATPRAPLSFKTTITCYSYSGKTMGK